MEIWVCNKCGSHEIQERVWRHCNSGECDGIGEADEEDSWCMNCQETTTIVEKETYQIEKETII